MGKIFYVMGKSASGKDTVYKKLLSRMPELKTVSMYTTRPIRDGEHNGVEYFFVDPSYLDQCRKDGILIECRTYDTVYGPWSYFTADDGQIDLKTGNYLIMGTLESYGKMRAYYGEEALVPIYIHVEDGLRLRRALEREQQQTVPKYKEMCRRFLADEEDFSPSHLEQSNITRQYENVVLEDCLREIVQEIGRVCHTQSNAGQPEVQDI